jgi:CheY-like chemotaxis protein
MIVKSVLLVEDSRFLRVTNERALAKAGYSVLCAADGEIALELARKHVPDLILLDMLLPKLSGPETLHALKSDPITANVPVVVLSSLPQINEDKLKSEGAVSYFEKSKLFESSDGAESLIQVVREHLRLFEGKNL